MTGVSLIKCEITVAIMKIRVVKKGLRHLWSNKKQPEPLKLYQAKPSDRQRVQGLTKSINPQFIFLQHIIVYLLTNLFSIEIIFITTIFLVILSISLSNLSYHWLNWNLHTKWINHLYQLSITTIMSFLRQKSWTWTTSVSWLLNIVWQVA